jgi:hypothetical protein
LIVAQALSRPWIARLRHFEVRHDCAQIPTEALDGSFMVAMLLVAPTGPGAEEHFALNAVVLVYDATFPNEGTHWAGEIGQLL